MTVNYVQGVSAGQRMPISINPAAQRLDPTTLPIAADRHLVLGMGHGRGYISGQDFDVRPYTITSKPGTYEFWTISNPSGMAMFHCHILEHEDIGMMGVWNIAGEERGRDKRSRRHGSHPSTTHSEDEHESQPGPSHSH